MTNKKTEDALDRHLKKLVIKILYDYEMHGVTDDKLLHLLAITMCEIDKPDYGK